MMCKFAPERAVFALYSDIESLKNAEYDLSKKMPASQTKKLVPLYKEPEDNSLKDFVYRQKTYMQFGALLGAVLGVVVVGILEITLSAVPQHLNLYPLNDKFFLFALAIKIIAGTIAGTVVGALVGIGCPQRAGKRYGFYLKEGGLILAVRTNSRTETSKIIGILTLSLGKDITVLNLDEIWKTILPERNKLVERSY